MNIQSIPIGKIKAAAYNPRKDLKPGDPEYEKLKKSIAEFDMVEPLVWNERSGNLCGGHQRLKILKERGDTEVEVSVVDLDDIREKALNIALNKISGEWDMPLLKDLIEELDNGDFDMEITGFDLKEIEDLMTQFHVPEEGQTDEDAVPEATESISKRGDLWQLGKHRLLNGDATVLTDVERLMGGEKADMVFTDPPYNVDYNGMQNSKQWDKIANDAMPPEEFQDWLTGALTNYYLTTSDAAGVYICHSDKSHVQFRKAFETAGFGWRATIIWVKNSPAFNFAQYKYKHEPIFYCYKEGETVNWYGDRKQHTVWDAKKEVGLHPTIKPVELISNAINNSSRVNNIVSDLFGGSGTTLIACEKLGRRCYMMEIDCHYTDVIIARFEAYSGKKAVRLD